LVLFFLALSELIFLLKLEAAVQILKLTFEILLVVGEVGVLAAEEHAHLFPAVLDLDILDTHAQTHVHTCYILEFVWLGLKIVPDVVYAYFALYTRICGGSQPGLTLIGDERDDTHLSNQTRIERLCGFARQLLEEF